MATTTPCNSTSLSTTKDTNAVLCVTSYRRRDLLLDVITSDPSVHAPVLPSISTPFSAGSRASLGALAVLPIELLQEIFLQTSIESLFRLRQTNRRIRYVVDGMHEYRRVASHALEAYRSLLRSGVATTITLRRLFGLLCQEKCVLCGEFAGFLCLVDCVRCCFHCIKKNPRLRMHELTSLELFCRSAEKPQGLAVIKSIPGRVPCWTDVGKERWLVRVWPIMCPFDDGIVAATATSACAPWPRWATDEEAKKLRAIDGRFALWLENVLAHLDGRRDATLSFVRYNARSTFRACTPLPFLDLKASKRKALGKGKTDDEHERGVGEFDGDVVQDGVYCKGCRIAVEKGPRPGRAWQSMSLSQRRRSLEREKVRLTDLEDRVYSTEGLLEHVKQCEEAAKLWEKSEGGTVGVIDGVFVEREGLGSRAGGPQARFGPYTGPESHCVARVPRSSG
ncbi:hypothetical protein K402DRAFT_395884 [Aulographum hederae CBS 113979]|uniref:F-box domain-containing protein n=1 Tax=Aulographum hederae CBS 113979 TaxID=1176131 RepID=A0A6G1GTZ6_9PEZI|nr:hypothetical protein K402DRAFT_395884 [Aulographum hederae CBS 113979]